MPKPVDHDERRRRIAKAACEAIAEQGLEGATLARVGRRCGLTTGAIAHYFEDKDALLLAALHEAWHLQIERMDAHRWRPEHTLLEVLSEALSGSADGYEPMRVWLAFWGRAVGDEKIAAAQRIIHEQWLGRVRAEMRRAVERGRLPASLPIAREAEGVIAHIRGLCIRGLFEPERWGRRRQVEYLARYLERLADGARADASSGTRRAS